MQYKCPTCEKLIKYDLENPHRPFCCERCKLIDLGNWASEAYAVPVSQNEPPTDNDIP